MWSTWLTRVYHEHRENLKGRKKMKTSNGSLTIVVKKYSPAAKIDERIERKNEWQRNKVWKLENL